MIFMSTMIVYKSLTAINSENHNLSACGKNIGGDKSGAAPRMRLNFNTGILTHAHALVPCRGNNLLQHNSVTTSEGQTSD